MSTKAHKIIVIIVTKKVADEEEETEIVGLILRNAYHLNKQILHDKPLRKFIYSNILIKD